MPRKLISEFPEVTTVTDSDLLIVRDNEETSSYTKKVQAQYVAEYVAGNISSLAISQVSGLQAALDAKQPLDADLTAVAALSSTGMLARTGTATYAERTITGTANEVTLTNGSGASGNPTVSLPAALTFTGKTVTGGTLSNPTITLADNAFTVQDNGDATKQLQFQLSGITTGNTRTLTVPDASTTIVGHDATQTLTNKTLSLGSNTVSATLAQLNSAVSDADVASLAGTETLTNKTVNLANNTLTGTTAEFNTALSDANFATQAGSETLTNKTIALGSNTVSGTLAEFNTAVTDANLASIAGTETLTNKTIDGNNNTLTVLGATQISGDIPFSNIAQLANNRVAGNVSGSTGDIAALTGAQVGGLITLADLSDTDAVSPTKGKLLVGDGDSWNELAVGTNDHVLTADSGQGVGVKWAAAPGAGGGITNGYDEFTDGSVTTGASGGDTFKFRAGTGVVLTLASNDVTHGDNLLVGLDAEISCLAGLTSAAGKVPYYTGSGTASVADFTSVARTLVAQTSQANMRTTGLGLGTSATLDETTTAQYLGNTADKILSTDQVNAAGALFGLTDGATINWDMASGFNASVTLGGNRSLANPTNTIVGRTGAIVVTQDGTGSRTLSYGTNWEAAGGSFPVLSTAASSKDVIYYWIQSSSSIVITGILKAVA